MGKHPDYPAPVGDADALPKNYGGLERERFWQAYWAQCGVYKFEPYVDEVGASGACPPQGQPPAAPTKRLRTRDEIFSIDTPPPTVSGKLHIGHVYSYTQTDMNARYQRMRGKHVFYPFGFDDNGLPTERLVETVTGKRANDVIAESGREAFIELCKPIVEGAEREFIALWKSLALSCDWDQFYTTINERSRAISQSSFIDLYNKGYVYRKVAPTQWDWVNQTAIAQAEIEDREVPGHFHDIRFGWADGPGEPVKGDLVIATTRPELIPACVAVFAHPDDARYQHLFGKVAITPLFEVEVPILPSAKANPEKGTGILMCCTFGDMDDVEHWKEHNLPTRVIIGRDGRITDFSAGLNPPSEQERAKFLRMTKASIGTLHWPTRSSAMAFAHVQLLMGLKVKQAREKIKELLQESGTLLGVKDIVHTVRHAERGDVPVEILVTPQWYVNILDHKQALLEQGRKVNWHPEYMRKRYEQWVEGLNTDWCISRQRYNGVPFPVWYDHEQPVLAELNSLPVNPLTDKPSEAALERTWEQFEQQSRMRWQKAEERLARDPELAAQMKAQAEARIALDPPRDLTAGERAAFQSGELKFISLSALFSVIESDVLAKLGQENAAFVQAINEGQYTEPTPEFVEGLAEELRQLGRGDVAKGLSQLDQVGAITPDPDVMDTWATSSCTPYLNTHLLLQRGADGELATTERFSQLFPFDMRPQAHDIIRTWAFYTIAKAYFHFGEIPWQDIVISGHAQDAGGKKISKSKGHVVTPAEMVEKYTADGLRYWSGSVRLGTDTLYDERNLTEGRKLINKLFNATKFALRHLLDFDPAAIQGSVGQASLPASLKGDGRQGRLPHWDPTELIVYPTDLWLIGRLNETIERATKANDAFEFGEAKQAVEDFFWADLCDNYLELSKGRLYGEPLAVDAHLVGTGGACPQGQTPSDPTAQYTAEELRQSAQATLHLALTAVLRLFAPVLPHITEECWSWHFARFSDKRSIHEEPWPSSVGTGLALSAQPAAANDSTAAPRRGHEQPVDQESRDAASRVPTAAALLLSTVAAVRKWKSEHSVSVKKPLAKVSIYRTALAHDNSGANIFDSASLRAVLGDLLSTCNAQQALFVEGVFPLDAVMAERGTVAVVCEIAPED